LLAISHGDGGGDHEEAQRAGSLSRALPLRLAHADQARRHWHSVIGRPVCQRFHFFLFVCRRRTEPEDLHVLADEPPGLVPLQPPQGTQGAPRRTRTRTQADLPAVPGQLEPDELPAGREREPADGQRAGADRRRGGRRVGAPGARGDGSPLARRTAVAAQEARGRIPAAPEPALRRVHGRRPRPIDAPTCHSHSRHSTSIALVNRNLLWYNISFLL